LIVFIWSQQETAHAIPEKKRIPLHAAQPNPTELVHDSNSHSFSLGRKEN
jgi:hypothetical protein